MMEYVRNVLKLALERQSEILLLLCVLIALYLTLKPTYEGLSNRTNKKFEELRDHEIYTPLYAAMHQTLFQDRDKDTFEGSAIAEAAGIAKTSRVVEVGCGAGNRLAEISKTGCTVIGIDRAGEMVKRAKKEHPSVSFFEDDVIEPRSLPGRGTFTHVLLLNFGIYRHEDKGRLFRQLRGLLAPGGKLAVHLVDRDRFDPIVPAASVFTGVSPQNYTEKRITRSHVVFDTHDYSANLETPSKGDKYTFVETITPKDGGTITQNRTVLHMPVQKHVLGTAKDMGFHLVNRLDLDKVGYRHNYIYILQKAE